MEDITVSSQPYLPHWSVLILPMCEQVDPGDGYSTEDGTRRANGRNAHKREVATKYVTMSNRDQSAPAAGSFRHSPKDPCRKVGQKEPSRSHFPLDLVRVSVKALSERTTTHLRADRNLRKHVEDQVDDTSVQEDGGDEAEPLVGLLVVEATEPT